MSRAIVEASGLKKTYRRGKIDVPALNGVSLIIKEGEVVSVVGPSGSGKTTLLNLIGGLDTATEGKVLVDGVDLETLDETEIADYRLRKIGFIFQFFNLIPTLTALENVEVPMVFAKIPEHDRRGRALDLLNTVGLKPRLDHKPEELSGGEQQRVAIARALANNPSVILADEPTGDLDSKSATVLMELVQRLNREMGKTFIMVTHDPLVVQRSTTAYAIRDGQIEGELSTENVEGGKMDA